MNLNHALRKRRDITRDYREIGSRACAARARGVVGVCTTPIEGSAPRKSGPFAAGWAAAVGYARVLHRRVAPARPQRAGSNKNNAGEDAGDDEEMPSRMDSFRFGHAKHSESRVVYVTADASAQGPNAGFRFKGNAISTGKYSPITFFPKGLYEQFRRVAKTTHPADPSNLRLGC